MIWRTWISLATILLCAGAAQADDLYPKSNWSSMAADRRAADPGDLLTIVIFQSAEPINSAQSNTRKSTDLAGSISGGPIEEGGSIEFGGGFSGRGEVRRSERFVGQITLTVRQVLPNGDLMVAGDQWMLINGERTRIGIRGRVRTADINADNIVVSNRIADAEIEYNGRGFVSRSSKPGILNHLFSLLGLG